MQSTAKRKDKLNILIIFYIPDVKSTNFQDNKEEKMKEDPAYFSNNGVQ